MERLQDQVAIVTGGASGIGRAICGYLAREGARVVVSDLDLAGAEAVAREITQQGGQAQADRTDVTDPEAVRAMIGKVAEEQGRIDWLFNNAGIASNGEFQDMSLEDMRKIVDVNFWGVIYGCYHVYPVMMRQGFGRIVNVSSLAGLIPGGLMTSYAAAKHAVVGFSVTLRSEARQYGIRVCALCPGYVETPMHSRAANVTEYVDGARDSALKARMHFPTAEESIAGMMRGVMKDRAIVLAPARQRVFWWLYRLFPGLWPWVWVRIIRHIKGK